MRVFLMLLMRTNLILVSAEGGSLIFLMKNLTNLCKVSPIVSACLRYFF